MNQDPFFIVYKARSGSTFLANLLNKHQAIAISPESNIIMELWKYYEQGVRVVKTKKELLNIIDSLYQEKKLSTDWEISKEQLADKLIPSLPIDISEIGRQAIFLSCREQYPHSQVWGLKKGGWYARNIEAIKQLFPTAKIIYLLRDGRAIFASSKQAIHTETGLPYETDAIKSALHWQNIVKQMIKYQNQDFFLEVKYEDLLTDPEEIIKEILSFLQVDNTDEIIKSILESQKYSFPQRYEYLHTNVGKPPLLSRINAWQEKLSDKEIREFERVAGESLKEKGYDLQYSYSWQDNLYGNYLNLKASSKKILKKIFK